MFEDGKFTVEVIDAVQDYADLMQELFDFSAIKKLLASGFKVQFDAMHAVTCLLYTSRCV